MLIGLRQHAYSHIGLNTLILQWSAPACLMVCTIMSFIAQLICIILLVHKESCKHLGMVFHKRMSRAKSSEHAAGPFMASANRIRQFVQEKSLTGRPRVSLWLGKTYVILAGMYGGQVWGTEYLRHGKEFVSDLLVCHMSFLKSTLGVKHTTTNWAILRECGHEPLQYYWFRSAVKLYNSMLRLNSVTVQKVLRALVQKVL